MASSNVGPFSQTTCHARRFVSATQKMRMTPTGACTYVYRRQEVQYSADIRRELLIAMIWYPKSRLAYRLRACKSGGSPYACRNTPKLCRKHMHRCFNSVAANLATCTPKATMLTCSSAYGVINDSESPAGFVASRHTRTTVHVRLSACHLTV